MCVQAQAQCINGTSPGRVDRDLIDQIEADCCVVDKHDESIGEFSEFLLRFVEDDEAMELVRTKILNGEDDKAIFEKSREHCLRVLRARYTDPEAYAKYEMFETISIEMDSRLSDLRDAITHHLNLY